MPAATTSGIWAIPDAISQSFDSAIEALATISTM